MIPAPEVMLLTGGRLVDGTGAAPVDDAEIHLRDGLVQFAGPAALAPPAPLGARRIDVTGHTVLPGFFDCHTHLTMRPQSRIGGTIAQLTDPMSLRVLRAVPNLSDTLDAGVTTVRDLSGADLGIKLAVEQGLVRGPRLVIAIRILSITGGHGDWRAANGVDLAGGSGGGGVADGPDAFVRATREVLQAGADCVKVAASGGMTSPRSSPEHGGLTEDELRAVVREAARHGDVPVAAHAQDGPGIPDAVRAGVRSIEHGYHVRQETVSEMVDRGTFLVPTLATLTRERDPATTPAPELARRRATVAAAKERLAAAMASGVRVALGTDAGLMTHGANLRELGLMVELGLSPMAAIVAGTSAAAELCGLDAELGSLTPGKRADVVVCAGDPLADITVLADPDNVVLVVKDGAVQKDRVERGAQR
ncbi:amidohydrolase family protein [Pseudonocardia sp. CA-107938]|uniref:metal-dependent hydrolase family protein n=1 Tax=Pseudonocardia sp. CA-107938 TaxID=3240021 RepID=UPI003D8B668F